MLRRAVFLDLASIHPEDLDLSVLENVVEEWSWFDNVSPDKLTDAIADASVVVTNKVVIDVSHIVRAHRLKLICAAATGYNNIDIEAASLRGVAVANARAYATPSVVQHVFVLLLSLLTSIDRYRQEVKDGSWSSSRFFCLLDHPVSELAGKTLGIVGYGELGQSVASVARCFGMHVLVARRDQNDDRDGRIALQALLPQVDVLSLHCPLTETTTGLIGEAELALMKPDAILINTARGGLVDEQALLQALDTASIGGAGLDVLEHEPPSPDDPLVAAERDNLIITPHTAWASRESRQRLITEIAENIQAYGRGERRNIVN